MRTVGTTSRGVRCPVVREGDDLVKIVTDAILACGEEQGLTFHDRDIVAVTEAVVARSQGNYAGVEDIAAECRAKFGADTVALTFPILSRNRIAICLKGIAKAFKKVYILMSYPSDEVGNHLFDEDLLDEKGVNPWSDVLDEAKYRELFGYENASLHRRGLCGVLRRPVPCGGLRAEYSCSETTCAPCCRIQRMCCAATSTPASAPGAAC